MKFYVAGSSKEIERAERIMAALRAAGHEITEDWCAQMRAEGTDDRLLSRHQRAMYDSLDARGVIECDWFWLLVPETESSGAWVELGIAIGNLNASMVSGNLRRSIFLALANELFSSDDAALAWVLAGFPQRAGR